MDDTGLTLLLHVPSPICDNITSTSYYIYIYIYTTLRGRIKGNCRAIYLILSSAEGNIGYIALSRGQYSDIAREGGFQQPFEQLFDTKLS